MKKKVVIKKTMTIGEVLRLDENLAEVLLGFGMHCFGCPVSQMESLEDAAAVHGVDIDLMIEKLNEAVNSK